MPVRGGTRQGKGKNPLVSLLRKKKKKSFPRTVSENPSVPPCVGAAAGEAAGELRLLSEGCWDARAMRWRWHRRNRPRDSHNARAGFGCEALNTERREIAEDISSHGWRCSRPVENRPCRRAVGAQERPPRFISEGFRLPERER